MFNYKLIILQIIINSLPASWNANIDVQKVTISIHSGDHSQSLRESLYQFHFVACNIDSHTFCVVAVRSASDFGVVSYCSIARFDSNRSAVCVANRLESYQ